MAIVIRPDHDPTARKFEVLVKVRSEHTNEVITIIEETIPPGGHFATPIRTTSSGTCAPGEVGILVGDQTRASPAPGAGR